MSMSSNDRRFVGAGREAQGVWSPATLSVERLIARAGATIAARGRAYYAQKWRLRVQHVSAEEAVVRVRGSQQYTVEFMRAGGRVLVFCDCPYADYDEDVICKHGVAAALFLRDHLKQNAPVPWEDVLSQAVRTSPRPEPKGPAEFLFFSLQARGNSWAVVPYTVAARLFTETARQDVAEAARIVAEQKLSSQAEKVGPYEAGERRVYANVTHAQAALVKMLASSGLYYGSYYGGAALDLGALFALLKGGPLFLGTDKNPLKRPLEICTDIARIELEMERAEEGGTRLSALAVAGERVFPLRERGMQVVSYRPLWLLSEQTVFQLDAPPEGFALFHESPEIDIPGDEEQAFFEKHLPYLAERFPLRGEAARWEQLRDIAPVPRLYLTEEGQELRV